MDNSNYEKKPIGKMGAIIIVLAIAIVISMVIIGVAIVSIVKGDSSSNTLNYDYSYSENPDLYQTTQGDLGDYFTEDVVTDSFSETVSSDSGQQGNGSDNKNTTKNTAIENYEQLSKNGDNMLSDHHDNQYIKLVAGEYEVDTDLLVAIYSVPDTGNNFVLEFDGTKDSSGNYVKSPDTLKTVYQIDLERNIKVATSSGVGNVGVSYAEGLFCFNMVKTLVMEQYPDYFTGIN
ncbi:MAG: hypothetical protein E7530_01840 [Ruminococcaceae bacterium]|nr:hypothetical protein [Oscillospiraceae bacterium]